MKTLRQDRPWRLVTSTLVALLVSGAAHQARAQSDNCANATPLPIGEATPNLTGFTLDGTSACGGAFPDGWYSVNSPTNASKAAWLD